jgi:hypothetical protein
MQIKYSKTGNKTFTLFLEFKKDEAVNNLKKNFTLPLNVFWRSSVMLTLTGWAGTIHITG